MKVKHLKILLLIIACIGTATYYVNVEGEDLLGSSDTYATTSAATQPTQDLTNALQEFLAKNDNQKISTDDVSGFTNDFLQTKLGEPITLDTLPQIDDSKIQKIPQNYSSLSPEERKQKEKEDARQYLNNLVYIFFSNTPTPLMTPADVKKFQQDFQSHLANLSNPADEDYAFFRTFGTSLQKMIGQASTMPVPETLFDEHIKFLRILSGFVALKDKSLPSIEDPMTRTIILSRVAGLLNLTSDFIKEIQPKFSALN